MKAQQKKKVIYQYDLNRNLINTFSSVKEASVALNISATAISNNIAGRSMTAGHYDFYLEPLSYDDIKE